jgi:hypothetical protein
VRFYPVELFAITHIDNIIHTGDDPPRGESDFFTFRKQDSMQGDILLLDEAWISTCYLIVASRNMV